jgi:glycosyltransferase involved in cell wall biosynthesis
MRHQDPRVSVIIPCYNQASFLLEALASVRAQTYPAAEIVVVDDGSVDHTIAVAARHPGVRCLRQANQGTAAARNLGVGASAGEYLVLLDADDRLLPGALAAGVAALDAHPECGVVFGLARDIDEHGAALPHVQEPVHEDDAYLALLRGCTIWHPAAAIARRAVFAEVGGFDVALPVSSDYDWYLRVARRGPLHCHNQLVSEYRQHGGAKSADNARMLRYTLAILEGQRTLVRGDRAGEEAWRAGVRNAREHYCRRGLAQVRALAQAGGDRRRTLRSMLMLLRHGPRVASRLAGRKMLRLLKGDPRRV